jgi:molybdate transport system substrate-binding protein
LREIGNSFEKKYGTKVVYDFAGSGRLGNKILVGQIPDLFIPGSAKWAKILKKKGDILKYPPIAYHTPVIITPEGNGKIKSLQDFMNNDNRIVLGDAKAAAIGGISVKIFQKARLDESKMNIKARGVTVKQLVLWIEGNNADASIVWRADAVQSAKVRIVPISAEHNVTDIIPLCRMAKHKKAATQLSNYILSPEGKQIFNKHGFKAAK